jgi:hypothetical protein
MILSALILALLVVVVATDADGHDRPDTTP